MAPVTAGRSHRGTTGAALLAVALLAVAAPARSGPARVHVRGGSQLEASLSPGDGDSLLVRGELHDDTQAGLGAAPVTFKVLASKGAAPAPPPAVRACGTTPRGAVRAAAGADVAVETDERGAFCVSMTPAPLAGTIVRVTYAGSKLHDATEVELTADAEPSAPARPVLRFDPVTTTIDLDKPEATAAVTLRVERSDGARATGRREGLRVLLEDERGRRLAEAPTGGDGRARFEVKTDALDGAGAGELRARFEGSDLLAKASATEMVIRTATVRVTSERAIYEGDPDDGVAIDVAVASSRGAVDGGIVEATRGGESVGAGEVKAGRATVLASFATERAGDIPIVLRYVPAAPWWRPGLETKVTVRAAGPGPLRHILLTVVVAALAAWVVRGWRRAPKPPVTERDSIAPTAPTGRAGVAVVEATRPDGGWRGRVVDAHEGAPIAGATLRVIAPAFEGDGIVAEATSSERGEFVLETRAAPDARLSVESPLHAAHEQALPAPSVIVVALVTRRRALLDRLVRWARRYGQPFDGPPEPTPGHVRRVASRVAAVDVENWASRVEAAAFGAAPVDAAAERAAREGEPGAPQRAP
jgi:hypothetical protein